MESQLGSSVSRDHAAHFFVGTFVFLVLRLKSIFDFNHCLRKFPALSAREHAQVHCQSVLPFDRLNRFYFFASPFTANGGARALNCLPRGGRSTDNKFGQSKRGRCSHIPLQANQALELHYQISGIALLFRNMLTFLNFCHQLLSILLNNMIMI